MKRLLFVCTENANRSQMAEGFARYLGGDAVEAWSAGSRPSGTVNPKAVAAMAGLGVDLGSHTSKAIGDLPDTSWDAVVTMGCGDACPHVAATLREDWALTDPRDLHGGAYERVRDEIGSRVGDLLERLGVASGASRSPTS